MNLLDENLRQSQRELLAAWRIPVRQIGTDVGRSGMQDDEIISLLHRLSRPTLFTRDRDFYRPELRHARYCLVHLEVPRPESADYIRRLLKHPSFDTLAKRLGNVVRVSAGGLHVWRLNTRSEEHVAWHS